MAQPQLSPRKYIQTRARTLPIYKCLVNRDWREGDMASVFVMRRHVNGNITAGSYLVDLLCLGVKDTFFWFNEPESDVMERIPPGVMMEIDYNLAHNIIWAGHDFAADFGIDPVKDFALTQLILEADNDAIPLIEIRTGDESGKPVLIVDHAGQQSAALATLRKGLGEDGFGYFVRDEVGPDDSDAPGMDQIRLSDIPAGQLGIADAAQLRASDLHDNALMESRPMPDQHMIEIERFLRVVPAIKLEYFTDLNEHGLVEEDWVSMRETLTLQPGSDLPSLDPTESSDSDASWLALLTENNPVGDTLVENARTVLGQYKDNLLVVLDLADFMLLTDRLIEVPGLISTLETFSRDFLVARIMLARIAAKHPLELPQHLVPEPLTQRLRDAFPGVDGYAISEHFHYFLLRFDEAIRRQDLRSAIRAYKGLSDVDDWSFSLMGLQDYFARQLLAFVAAHEDEFKRFQGTAD